MSERLAGEVCSAPSTSRSDSRPGAEELHLLCAEGTKEHSPARLQENLSPDFTVLRMAASGDPGMEMLQCKNGQREEVKEEWGKL
jgi:hypothetical protein